MVFPKSVLDIPEEELLKLLETKKEDTTELVVDAPNDIFDFIHAYNLKPGDIPVPTSTLYRLYFKWSKTPLTPRQFKDRMIELFPTKVSTRHYFLLDKSAIQIKLKTLEKINEQTRNPTKSKNLKAHYESFLNYYGIKAGRYAVNAPAFFYLYDKWNFENNRPNKLGPVNFIKMSKVYFEAEFIAAKNSKYISTIYFFLDKKTVNKHLSDEQIYNFSRKNNEEIKKSTKEKK